MSIRVYQFGLRPPCENEVLVRSQLRAAHDYRNALVAIERGRRAAIREIDARSAEVQEAVALVRAATRSTRRAAVSALRAARKTAREAARDELAEIAGREHEILLSARADTTCFWGTYLDIEAAHRQSRAQPLYGVDAVTPNDPAFARGPRWDTALAADDPRREWWLSDGQVGIQLQGGLPTPAALACTDTRVRLHLTHTINRGRRAGTLWLRVGSEGRLPIWAKWPILVHRSIPDAAKWKWVRVSLRTEGMRERWSVEITVDDPSPDWRQAVSRLVPESRVVALEWEWSPLDDGGIRVARYVDAAGASVRDVVLPARIANGIRKPSGIRAVRDMLVNDMRDRFVRAVRESRGSLPRYVTDAANTMHLWRSTTRYTQLAMRCRLDGVTGPAYEILYEWAERDRHLLSYESGARGEALRERREWYRIVAAQWRSEYRTILLSDQDLSREARWGDDGDVRFVAGVSEFRAAIRNAFGDDAVDGWWRDGADEDDDRSWCERCRDAWLAGGARGDGMFSSKQKKPANAWANRKEKSGKNQNGSQPLANRFAISLNN